MVMKSNAELVAFCEQLERQELGLINKAHQEALNECEVAFWQARAKYLEGELMEFYKKRQVVEIMKQIDEIRHCMKYADSYQAINRDLETIEKLEKKIQQLEGENNETL